MNQTVLILFAHPAIHKSRINKVLLENIPDSAGITFHDLYNSYPDYHIHVKKEQELLLQHDIIIWQHPFYWYSAPALLKEWIDLVLEHGWAYGREGNMLKDKQVMTVITTGGGEQAYQDGGYNQHTISQFLAPFRQTVKLCKMHYLPPFVVHGTHLLNEQGIREYGRKYKRLLETLSGASISPEQWKEHTYSNFLID